MADGTRRLSSWFVGGVERELFADDGTRLIVRAWHEGTGTPLILCDGLGCDGYIWKYVERRFAGERPLLHLQYRGHGRSQVPNDLDTLKVEVIVDDLARALDHAGLTGGVWLGHSMGVQVALEAFRRLPERVHGLALLCGACERPIDTWHHAAFADEEAPFGNRLMQRIFDGLSRGVIDNWRVLRPVWQRLLRSETAYRLAVNGELNPELVRPDDFRPYLLHLAEMDMRVFARLARDLSEHSARDVLPDIDVPTLVVGGGRDRFAPLWVIEELHGHIPEAELLPLVLASHAAPIEEPRLIERALERLLQRVDG
ncbi:MAG: alpha/beta hydrolase [Deltaproteobacteria bacterium]|nr:alpha/beta hydrolase [Deltaproteobacteria bacterium]